MNKNKILHSKIYILSLADYGSKKVTVMKKAQGLPISTIILAAIGLVVLILLFALVTGRIGLISRATAECPGTCIPEDQSTACDPQLSRELPGTYIAQGQPTGLPPEKLKKCSKCCVSIA